MRTRSVSAENATDDVGNKSELLWYRSLGDGTPCANSSDVRKQLEKGSTNSVEVLDADVTDFKSPG